MSSDIEELAREGMRQFTATMQVSPDLAAQDFERHRSGGGTCCARAWPWAPPEWWPRPR